MILLVLRLINVTLWVLLAFQLAPTAMRIFRQELRFLDGLFFGFWMIAVNYLMFSVRGILYDRPETHLIADITLTSICYCVSISICIYVNIVAWKYGKHDG